MPSPKDDPSLLQVWQKLAYDSEYRSKYRAGTIRQIAKEYGVSYSTVRYWLGSSRGRSTTVEDSREQSRNYGRFERTAQGTIFQLFLDHELLNMDEITIGIQKEHGVKPRPKTVLKYIDQINQASDFQIEEDASHPGNYRKHKKETPE